MLIAFSKHGNIKANTAPNKPSGSIFTNVAIKFLQYVADMPSRGTYTYIDLG